MKTRMVLSSRISKFADTKLVSSLAPETLSSSDSHQDVETIRKLCLGLQPIIMLGKTELAVKRSKIWARGTIGLKGRDSRCSRPRMGLLLWKTLDGMGHKSSACKNTFIVKEAAGIAIKTSRQDSHV